jgi:3-isopropylmalate dehydrogenase
MKTSYEIGVIGGDGTGPEVVAEGIKALKAISKTADFDLRFTDFAIGGDRYLKEGVLVTDEEINRLKAMDAIFLGAIGHPEVMPGILERDILLRLRFELDLYVNLRPVALFEGVDTPLKGKGPKDIDFVVIRENSEGMYAGGGGFFKKGTPDEIAIQESVNTRKGVERCIRYAFDHCRKRGARRLLTLCAKTNVLVYESDLWRRAFYEVAKEYPDVTVNYQHVDALSMWMIKNPEQFDVIVTGNLFGDIITDIGAIIQGGLGIAAGGNINPEGTAMFEPIGGSAPKYAGQGKINPLAAICAAQMMLAHLGEEAAADRLLAAVKRVVREKMVSLDAGKMGYSTKEVGDLVAESLSTL